MPTLATHDEQRATLAAVHALAQHGLMHPAYAATTLQAILVVMARGEMTVRDILEVK